MTIDLAKLSEPFEPSAVRWRIQQTWTTDAKEIRATCVPYIDNRAIMDRLDSVCGPENWRQEFKAGPAGGVICTLFIKINGEWLGKSDAADNTNIESVKGGISDSMKRAAVQWGMGRYLYKLKGPFYADVRKDRSGEYYQPANQSRHTPAFHWNPPATALAAPPAKKPAQREPKAEKPEGNGFPTDTVSKSAKALAAIQNAHSLADLKKFEKAIVDRAGVGEYSDDEFKSLEAAIMERREFLKPRGAAV